MRAARRVPRPCPLSQDGPRRESLPGETEARHRCRIWHHSPQGNSLFPSMVAWVVLGCFPPFHAGCALPLPLAPQDLSRKDCLDAAGSGVGELPPGSAKLSSSPSAVGTLKRPTTLSRHASAAGFPLPAAPRAVPKGHKTPTSYSPMEGGDSPFIDPEDISQLLADVARFADALEKLRDMVLRDGECPPRAEHLHHSTLAQTHPCEGVSARATGHQDPRGTVQPQSGVVVGEWWVSGARGQDNAASCPELFSSARFPVYSAGGASRLPGPPEPHGVPGTAPQPTRAASRRGWVVCGFKSSSPRPRGHRECTDLVVCGHRTPRCQSWFCRNPFPTLMWGLGWGEGFAWLGSGC